jgi:hypothetical protein
VFGATGLTWPVTQWRPVELPKDALGEVIEPARADAAEEAQVGTRTRLNLALPVVTRQSLGCRS